MKQLKFEVLASYIYMICKASELTYTTNSNVTEEAVSEKLKKTFNEASGLQMAYIVIHPSGKFFVTIDIENVFKKNYYLVVEVFCRNNTYAFRPM